MIPKCRLNDGKHKPEWLYTSSGHKKLRCGLCGLIRDEGIWRAHPEVVHKKQEA